MLQAQILEAITTPSILTYLLVFAGGVVLSITSCGFIRIPVLISYISGVSSSKRSSFQFTFAFASGLVFTYTLYGLFLGLIGSLAKDILAFSIFIYYLLGAVLVVNGLGLLGFFHLKLFNINKFFAPRLKDSGIWGVFLLGMLVTFFEAPACPCCGPIIFVLSSSTIARGNIFYGLSLFFIYALGQSLILLVLGASTGAIKYINCKADTLEEVIKVFAGILLFYLGLYFIWLA